MFLIGIAWWGLTLAHVPLRQGKEFAWNWYARVYPTLHSFSLQVLSVLWRGRGRVPLTSFRLAIYGVFLVAYVAICYYNNLVVPTFIGGTSSPPFSVFFSACPV